MKNKCLRILFILIVIIAMCVLNPKKANADDSVFSSDITYEWEFFPEAEGMVYGIYTPSTSEDYEALPLIIWLHGSGASVPTEELLKTPGIIKAMQNKEEYEKYSAYILCPRMKTGNGHWDDDIEGFKTMLESVIDTYNIDTDNIIICGESRGGTGALRLAYLLPEYFKKCVAFSPFYLGPFNESMDTLCCYSAYDSSTGQGDLAGRSDYVNAERAAFGRDRVFEIWGTSHGSVGSRVIEYDGWLAEQGYGEARK